MKVNGTPLSSGEGKRSAAAGPDPEVAAKATRRRFTAAYKLSIVEKADACETPGEIGELLRREGADEWPWPTRTTGTSSSGRSRPSPARETPSRTAEGAPDPRTVPVFGSLEALLTWSVRLRQLDPDHNRVSTSDRLTTPTVTPRFAADTDPGFDVHLEPADGMVR